MDRLMIHPGDLLVIPDSSHITAAARKEGEIE
jgi:hypothetical protein